MQDPVRNGGSRPEVGCGPGNSARSLRMADSIDDREAVQAAPPKPHPTAPTRRSLSVAATASGRMAGTIGDEMLSETAKRWTFFPAVSRK